MNKTVLIITNVFTYQLTTDYIAVDKMSYIFLLKLKKLTFIRYSSKVLKFRFSLKWFEENNMI